VDQSRRNVPQYRLRQCLWHCFLPAALRLQN